MKNPFYSIALCALLTSLGHASPVKDARTENLVIINDEGAKNLDIQTTVISKQTFEKNVFAIGRIKETPSSRSFLSSRVAGRVIEQFAFMGDTVKAGDVVAIIESRQPGNPPPRIEIKALRSGVVAESHISLGQPVDPEKHLMEISDFSTLWAVARIPETSASFITNGSPAHIEIPALGANPFTAKLLKKGTLVDPSSGSIDGIFELPNPADVIRPGMRVEFNLVISKRDNVPAIPSVAIQGDSANPIVFVKDFDLPNAFLKAPIKTGERNDVYTEVINGLFSADEVVTKGAYALNSAGAGSMSLKEALDAAHGHEHNEDGSDITEEQRKAKEAGTNTQSSSLLNANISQGLQVYSVAITLLCLILTQQLWNRKRKQNGGNS